MTSFSSENEAKNLQNGEFQTLKCDISRTIWRMEGSDGSLLCIFHALSFKRNLFFDRTCPLRVSVQAETCKTIDH